jgi:rhodanese-related sulfurtransferase
VSAIRILVPAAAIIAIGGGIGLADLARRHDRILLKLPEPPPLEPVKPASTGQTPDATTDTAPAGTQPESGTPADQASVPAATGETPTAQPAQAATTPAELPKGHITISQAWSLYEQQAFFVDARRKDVYVEGHVANAFRADMASFKSSTPAWVSGLPKDMILVVYCNGGDCDESEHVAKLLYASGFTAVYIMHDGYPAWKAAGHPVETGEGQE